MVLWSQAADWSLWSSAQICLGSGARGQGWVETAEWALAQDAVGMALGVGQASEDRPQV